MLILDSSGQLTGIVNCMTPESPFDTIVDACVSDGIVYLAGERDDDETDIPKLHRVAAYNRGGDYLGTAFEANKLQNHFIWVLAISEAPDGAVVAISGFEVREGDVDSTASFISVSLDDPQVITDDTEPRIVAVDHDTTMGSYDAGYCAEDDRYAVIALVGVLGKSSDGWKGMWLQTASEPGAPAGSATGLMFATRSIALVAQPFILGALLGASDSMAAIVIGLLCAACALLMHLATRRSFIARDAGSASSGTAASDDSPAIPEAS